MGAEPGETGGAGGGVVPPARPADTGAAVGSINPASCLNISPSSSLRVAAARKPGSPSPEAAAMTSSGDRESSAAASSSRAAGGVGAPGRKRDNGLTKCMNRIEKTPSLNGNQREIIASLRA